jgi:hypothetical protein
MGDGVMEGWVDLRLVDCTNYNVMIIYPTLFLQVHQRTMEFL